MSAMTLGDQITLGTCFFQKKLESVDIGLKGVMDIENYMIGEICGKE